MFVPRVDFTYHRNLSGVIAAVPFFLVLLLVLYLFIHYLLLPQGFRPEVEIPRRHSSNSRVY